MKEAEVWVRVYAAVVGGLYSDPGSDDDPIEIASMQADAAVEAARKRGYIKLDAPK